MKMVYQGLKKKSQLPDRCPVQGGLISGGDFCGVSFKDKKNIYQDTDLCVYCARCGICVGQFEKGTVSFVNEYGSIIRDDNIQHK